MKKYIKILSTMLAAIMGTSGITVVKAEEKSVWSYYMTSGFVNGAETGSGEDYGDIADNKFYVPNSSRYKGNQNSVPAVLVSPDNKDARPMIYVRPEIEWNIKISEDLARRVGFYPDSVENTPSGLSQPVVCFTAPNAGNYNIYADIINVGGNKYRSDGVSYGDGGWVRFTVLSGGNTSETPENTEQVTAPAATDTGVIREHIEYKKDNITLNENDRILMRVSAGASGEGDEFQIIYYITETDSEGNIINTYDLYEVASGLKYDDLTEQYEDAYNATRNPDTGEAVRKDFSEEATVLAGLGIIDELEIGKYSQDTGMTRAEFAGLLANMHGEVISHTKENSDYFADVISKHNPDAIDYLVGLGVIARAYKFYPDRVITYQEAAKMLVALLGYTIAADTLGGWADGYINIAARNELTIPGVMPTSEITRRQAAELAYKALDCDLLLQTFKSDGNGYKKGNDQTILSEYFDIYEAEGIVDGMENDSLSAPQSFRDEISISGKTYKYTFEELKDFYGMSIDFYYRETDDGECVVYAKPKKDNTVFEIEGKDISDFTFSQLRFEEQGRVKVKRINPVADILFNGRAITFSDAPINHMTGDCFVKAIDNDGDGELDVIFIDNYINYIVDTVDSVNELVFVKDSQTPLSMSDFDWKEISFKMANGKETTIENISRGDVVSVFDTLDGQRRKVIVSNLIVSGKIISVQEENSGYYVALVDEDTYYVSRSRNPSVYGEIGVGSEGTFVLDYRMKIVGADSSKAVYGYLIKAYVTDDEKGMFRIVNSSGDIVDYQGSDKMSYNGQSRMSGNSVAAAIRTAYSANVEQPIVFKVSGNEVKKILTKDAPVGTEGKFYVETITEFLKYGSTGKTFAGKLFTEDNTIYFNIPENRRPGQKATVTGVGGLINWQEYNNLIVLKDEPDSLIADVIYTLDAASSANIPETTPIFIVEKINEVLGEEDELLQQISGYYNGEYLTYTTAKEDTLKKVRPFQNVSAGEFEVGIGDIIRVGIDSMGRISAAEIFFDASSKQMLAPNPYTDYMGADYVLYANVYDKGEGLVKLTKAALDSQGVTLDSSTLINFRTNRIWIVDLSEPEKVRKAGYDDIKTYKKDGSLYSKVIVSQSSGIPRDIIIYK